MNLWTLKKLVIGANAEGVRKVKAAFRFDCGAEEIADFPRGASAAALCAIQVKRDEPTSRPAPNICAMERVARVCYRSASWGGKPQQRRSR